MVVKKYYIREILESSPEDIEYVNALTMKALI
jgi:hypothetical protein